MRIPNLTQIKENNGKIFDFKDVVESVDGCIVRRFDNEKLLGLLKRAAQNTVDRNNTAPIPYRGRVNEFGNYVQVLFGEECQKIGLQYTVPMDASGVARESGYPDGCVLFEDDYFCYVEVKTYAEANRNSPLRTFFYSPSRASKITRDAAHLLVGFSTQSQNAEGPHLLIGFHFTDMFLKKVQLKLEFNQNNRELYREDELL